MRYNLYPVIIILLALIGCRSDDENIITPEEKHVTDSIQSEVIAGFYLLNEGNMGSNKCTLDYYDAASGIYIRNIYGAANPNVVQELGDVGNDLKVYDGKLWAVINGSNLVEVMDATDAKHITQISIPNCRYICFDGDYAYVSSYAGPIQIDPNSRLGYVAKIDIKTMKEVAQCTVGYQPEEMVVKDGILYVANSGGYRVPNYDHTVSVIDLQTFQVTKTIDVAINLHRMLLDNDGFIWVSSRGDYYDIHSKLYIIDPHDDLVCDKLDLPCSTMTIAGDSLYVIGSAWNYFTNTNETTYTIINTKTRQTVAQQIITDETVNDIRLPYGIAINPETKEILITDAGDYITPGTLYCFSPDGKKKWSTRTGDIPAHFAFVKKKVGK